MTVRFLRNKVVEVESQKGGALRVSYRLTDDLLKLEVNLVVMPPDLEIVEANAKADRLPSKAFEKASSLIEKIEGVNIGPGLRKIVKGLLSEKGESPLLADAVLECCNSVILHFTRPGIEIGETVEDPEEKLALTRAMVQSNPRLVRSCIAFQDDSPIMKGLNL